MNEFKMTKSFHESFENALNTIEQKQEKKPMKFIYKVAAVAASFAVIGVAAVFTADATGIININSAFEKFMGIESNDRSKEIIQQLSNPEPIAEVTSDGITAKVVQSVNDDYAGNIMVELTAVEKILNPNMCPETGLSIPGAQLRAVSSFVVPEEDYHKPETMEEFAEKMKNEGNPPQLSAEEQAYYNSQEYIDKTNKEYIDKYNSSFTDKIYLFINFQSEGNISGKKIDLTINGLTGYTGGEEYINFESKAIDTVWNISYTAASAAPSKTYTLNQEINGIQVKDVTISPVSFVMTFNKPINVNEADDETDHSKIFFAGVRFKDGRTQYIPQGSGGYGPKEIKTSLETIVDVENIQSIFLGNKYTEIKLPEPN